MQFGGFPYPSTPALVFLSSVVGVLGTIVRRVAHPPVNTLLAALLIAQGTVLWACALTPMGVVPPPDGFAQRIRWFIWVQGGTALSLNQPLFYAGVLLVISGTFLTCFSG